MNANDSGVDAASTMPKEGTAKFEVLDMRWCGYTPRMIADILKEMGVDPPPGRKWSVKTVEMVQAQVAHIDPADVAGTAAYERKHRPPLPDEPMPDDLGCERPSDFYRRV